MPLSAMRTTLFAPRTTLLAPHASHSVASCVQDALNVLFTGDAPELFSTSSASVNENIKAIRNLTSIVHEVQADFMSVTKQLLRVDKARYRDQHGSVIKLAPKWKEYHKRFKYVLKKSQENANKARVYMNTYTDAILRDVDGSQLQGLQRDLSDFVTKLDTAYNEAQGVSEELEQLSEDITLFKETIQDAIDDAFETARAKISDQLDTTRAQLDRLLSRLTQMKEAPGTGFDVIASLIGSLTVGGASAGIAVLTLSPASIALSLASIITAIKDAIDLIKKKRQSGGQRREIAECEQKIEQLEALERALKDHEADLKMSMVTMDRMAEKIRNIGETWNILKTDVDALKQQLTLAIEMGTPVTERFDRKIQATRGLYRQLSKMLEEYAKQSLSI